jgi:hypothetical protein
LTGVDRYPQLIHYRFLSASSESTLSSPQVETSRSAVGALHSRGACPAAKRAESLHPPTHRLPARISSRFETRGSRRSTSLWTPRPSSTTCTVRTTPRQGLAGRPSHQRSCIYRRDLPCRVVAGGDSGNGHPLRGSTTEYGMRTKPWVRMSYSAFQPACLACLRSPRARRILQSE